MPRPPKLLLVVLAVALASAAPRWAPGDKDPGRVRISLYRVAPGKQLEFLRWMATQDEVSREAGVAAGQLYAHVDGDAWDFMLIAPVTTSEQDKKKDEIAARRGLRTGLPAALEFRQYLAWHTDTLSAGPTTAADLVAIASR
jgi:hypothetical protein